MGKIWNISEADPHPPVLLGQFQHWLELSQDAHVASRVVPCKSTTQDYRFGDWLTGHGLTSPPTQYRLYERRFIQELEDPTNSQRRFLGVARGATPPVRTLPPPSVAPLMKLVAR